MNSFKKNFKKIVLLFGILYPWIDWVFRKFNLPFQTIWDDVFLFIAILISLFIGVKRVKNLFSNNVFLLGLLFASVVFISFFINSYPFVAFFHEFRLTFEPFLFFVILLLINPEEDKEFYLKGLIVSAFFIALVGIYQYIIKVPVPASWLDKDIESSIIYTRAFSIFTSSNVLAGFLELLLPISLIFVFKNNEKIGVRFFGSLFFFITGLGIITTLTRASWLSIGGSMFLGLFFISPMLALLFIGLSSFFIYIVPTIRLRIVSLFDPSYIQKSLNLGRLFRWRYAVLNVQENPLFGSGLGTYGGSASQKYGFFVSTSMDSVYFRILAETGWLGFISYVLLVVYGIGDIFFKFFKSKNFYYLFIGIGLFAVVLNLFTENLLDSWAIAINFWGLVYMGNLE